MDPSSIDLAIRFNEAKDRTSVSWVSDKMTQAKSYKEISAQQSVYDEIISKLLDDKSELEMLARQYKDLYEKVSISDDDIEYLQKTVAGAVRVLSSLGSTSSKNDGIDTDAIVQLINKDTLKTMQLLGFNYKEAIGEPLTEACANVIRKKLGGSKLAQQNPSKKSR
ncbi:hypothetical protein BN1080_02839 [Planococcus massiliensis]|uniref:Uncharacterized protein n=1 Tax=Planococcus massiliensis TaxID=1499687 RepID=A0A098EPY2_9BACL|nr:hypothetical protein [Planococcus massiliensis]CEG23832.1 hypothetical protein BN1080_02839 [Planococcus massiliensis]